MKCDDIEILISSLLDGEVNESEKSILTDHLDQCPDCSLLMEELQKTENILDEVFCEPVNIDHSSKLWTKIEKELNRPAIPFKAIISAAAAVIIFGLAYALIPDQQTTTKKTDIAAVTKTEPIQISPGELALDEEVGAEITFAMMVGDENINMNNIVETKALAECGDHVKSSTLLNSLANGVKSLGSHPLLKGFTE